MDEIGNRVEEVDGVTRIYCANHADAACGNGDDELGYAPAEMVVSAGWLKVGDELACTAYCAAKTAGHDALDAKSKAFHQETISEEAAAAMPAPPQAQELDLGSISEFEVSE